MSNKTGLNHIVRSAFLSVNSADKCGAFLVDMIFRAVLINVAVGLTTLYVDTEIY